jgi:hypothetical protein
MGNSGQRSLVLAMHGTSPIGSVSVASAASIGECPNPVVRLNVFNTSAVSSGVLADAEMEATEIFRLANVMLVWRDSVPDGTGKGNCAVDLQVAVVRGMAERHFLQEGHMEDATLGFAAIKQACFCGRRAYIFSDRIFELGYRHGNPTALLGRVLAHEIGHLLLSSNRHSGAGIMRAALHTEPSFQPRFDASEVKALHGGVARLLANAR